MLTEHSVFKRYGILACQLLIFLALNVEQAKSDEAPESTAGMLGLLVSPSARINGMGQAGVAIPDEPGSYYNPATPAITTDHYFHSVNYCGKMKWLPELTDDMKYSYQSFQFVFGKEFPTPRIFEAIPFSVSTAIGYYNTQFDLRHKNQTSLWGTEYIGTIKPYEETDNYTISVGFHHLLDIGMGFTVKKLHYDEKIQYAHPNVQSTIDRTEASATAYDYGLIIVLPFIESIEYLRGDEIFLLNHLKPVLDVSTGFSWNNRGDTVRYEKSYDYNSLPLPRNQKIGIACKTGVLHREWQNLPVFSTTGTVELYMPQIQGITKDWSDADIMRGIEFSFLDTVDLRYGRYDDGDGKVHLKTNGYSIKSDGFFRFIALKYFQDNKSGNFSVSTIYRYIADHLSVTWSTFSYKKSCEWNPMHDTSHTQITVKF